MAIITWKVICPAASGYERDLRLVCGGWRRAVLTWESDLSRQCQSRTRPQPAKQCVGCFSFENFSGDCVSPTQQVATMTSMWCSSTFCSSRALHYHTMKKSTSAKTCKIRQAHKLLINVCFYTSENEIRCCQHRSILVQDDITTLHTCCQVATRKKWERANGVTHASSAHYDSEETFSRDVAKREVPPQVCCNDRNGKRIQALSNSRTKPDDSKEQKTPTPTSPSSQHQERNRKKKYRRGKGKGRDE